MKYNRTRRRRTLSRRKSYKRRPTIRKRTHRRRRGSKHTMQGGSNGLSQMLINSYRFTKNSALNVFNKLEGNSLVASANPTKGQQ